MARNGVPRRLFAARSMGAASDGLFDSPESLLAAGDHAAACAEIRQLLEHRAREVEQPLADQVALDDRAENVGRELRDYAGDVWPELRDELSGLITPDIENLRHSRGWPSACFAACKCQRNCIHPAICNMLTGDGALRDVIAWRALQPSLLPCSATLWPALERLFASPCPQLDILSCAGRLDEIFAALAPMTLRRASRAWPAVRHGV